MKKWYQLVGKENDVVIGTKVTMSRNVKGYNFTCRLSVDEQYEISSEVLSILASRLPDKFISTRMCDLDRYEAISLAERNLVTPDFVSAAEGKTFITTHDESLSIMVCEEDHLKLQAMLPGLELDSAFELADKLDTILDENLGFAFDRKLGYLTMCPTNIGTGMRATVMLQLPGIKARSSIQHLSNTVSKLGLSLTGAFGEGDNPIGSLYQLSNQVTLGISEEAALANLNSISLSIIQQERECRKSLSSNLDFEDSLWRSYGTLKNARVLSYNEFMNEASIVKIGITNGEIHIKDSELNELFFTMQPATINAASGTFLDRQIRDAKRAEVLRNIFE